MNTTDLSKLYRLSLESLIQEIGNYESNDKLWKVADGISNSGGNLCLHLLGNLNHFIGATLGNTGYVRNREAEFGQKDLSKDTLTTRLLEAGRMVETVLGGLSEEALNATYSYDFAGKESTRFYLVFFYGHFQYHLGQINYHRRLVN